MNFIMLQSRNAMKLRPCIPKDIKNAKCGCNVNSLLGRANADACNDSKLPSNGYASATNGLFVSKMVVGYQHWFGKPMLSPSQTSETTRQRQSKDVLQLLSTRFNENGLSYDEAWSLKALISPQKSSTFNKKDQVSTWMRLEVARHSLVHRNAVPVLRKAR